MPEPEALPISFHPQGGALVSDAEYVSEHKNSGKVEQDICPQYAKVPPVVRIVHIKVARQELVRRARRAKFTRTRRVRISHVPARKCHEFAEIPGTRQTRRRLNDDILNRRTTNLLMANSLSQNALDEIRIWRQMVHPSPPPKLAKRLQNTIKDHNKQEQETEQKRRNLCRGCHGSNSLPDRRIIKREDDPKHEVRKSRARGGEPYCPVPATKEDRGAEDVVWDSCQEL